MGEPREERIKEKKKHAEKTVDYATQIYTFRDIYVGRDIDQEKMFEALCVLAWLGIHNGYDIESLWNKALESTRDRYPD